MPAQIAQLPTIAMIRGLFPKFENVAANQQPSSPAPSSDNEERLSTEVPQAQQLEQQLADANLPVPHYVPIPANTDEEGSPVPHDAVCMVCASDNNSEQLLVCEGCKHVIHSYCMDDLMPDGLVPDADYLCSSCSPFQLADVTSNNTTGYSGIWHDKATLEAVQQTTLAPDSRSKERAKRYQWDANKKQLLTKEPIPRIVPQPAQRLAIIKAAHQALAHRGYRSTSDALRLRYTWKDMREDVKQYVQGCEECLKGNAEFKPVNISRLQSIAPSPIFTRFTIDLVGPLPPAQDTNSRYIAVAVDSYTKMVIANSLPNKSAAAVVSWFKNSILYKTGCPYEVNCDRGGEFMAEFQQLCDQHSIKITRGSAYHPQTQGLVERANQTLECALSKLTNDEPSLWEQHLQQAVFSMNASRQASTRFTPFYLLHGVEARLPLAIPQDSAWADTITEQDATATTLQQRATALNTSHSKVLDNVKTAQAQQAKAFKKRKGEDTPLPVVGQLVYMLKPRSKSGSKEYEGPYKVASVSSNTVTLEDGLKQTWSVNMSRISISDNSPYLHPTPTTKRRKQGRKHEAGESGESDS